MTSTTTLPTPDSIAQQYSDQLLSVIKQTINFKGGKISFAEYMDLCLYAPGLGYYSAGSHKIGAEGDFTTAPEISALFSRTLAHHVRDVLQQLPVKNILEFGAGKATMAIDLLLELECCDCLPEHYYIIEASADLQQRQCKSIALAIPHLKNKIKWLTSLPRHFEGVILANEVCDAMPVHSLQLSNDSVQERYITISGDELAWCEDVPSHPDLLKRAEIIKSFIDNRNYQTEVNLAAEAWLASIADTVQQGAVFIIDYGYPQSHYFHPERSTGTLMCFYKHQGHDNPLALPGLQDITAHVDFTALAQTAHENGLDVAGFQSQADFLLSGGIIKIACEDDGDNAFSQMQRATEIKRLILPNGMGESFKVLTLTKNLNQSLPKLETGDRRYSL